MPIVPSYDGLRTGITPQAPQLFSAPSGPNAQEIAGQQMQQTGAAVSRLGAEATQASALALQNEARIAAAMQEQVDRVRVNDAVNQARQAAQDLAYNPESGYLNLKGHSALERPDGKSLVEEYGTRLQDHFRLIEEKLSTDGQRQAFQANAAGLHTQFSGQVQSHLLGEFRAHSISVQDGTIALADDDARRFWNQPEHIAAALGAARAAVVEKGRISGWSASQIDAALLGTTSKVHSAVIMSALENGNPAYAMGYLDSRKKEMTADDILRVQGHVNKEAWQQAAVGAVASASADAVPALAPTHFDRMVHITAMSESGGRETDAHGRTITSPKGAQGVMQVMPGTNKDPGYGVKPAADNSPEERARVGRDYLQAMLQKYGDPAKAWAAYNAGPGALEKAMKAARNEHNGQPGDWLALMPKETQAYVAKNMQALGSGASPQAPTELDFVNRAVAALPPGAPAQAVELTRAKASQQWGLLSKSMTEKADAALASAQRFIASNPGATLDQVPAATLDALRQFGPGKLDDLTRYAASIHKPESLKTDLRLYNRLEANPEELARMTDAQFESLRVHMEPQDFKYFSRQRAEAIAGTSNTGAEAINSSAMKAALESRLTSLEIPTSPKASDTAAQERLGGIKQFVRSSLFEAQRAAGRKFTPEEVETHIDKLFTSSVEMSGVLWGTNTRNLMSMQIGDLPSGAEDGLRQALVAAGNKKPTNTDILNLYRKINTRGN